MTGLVDYSSSSSAASLIDSVDGPDGVAEALAGPGTVETASASELPPTKKRRTTQGTARAETDDHHALRLPQKARGTARDRNAAAQDGQESLPPLPSAFHDLYASTVRQSAVDDPSLHHGRRRTTPHIVGHWPSHLYIEWHPSESQYDKLIQLIEAVRDDIGSQIKLEQLITSDLGTPLPLHISLSRPITMTVADKERFLEKVTTAVHGCGQQQFSVRPRGLAWFRSPDSDRTFLIIRVTSTSTHSETVVPNPELTGLLRKCNGVVGQFGQPVLYQREPWEPVGTAFHVSIGWSFDRPDEEASVKALQIFKLARFREMRRWEIGVGGVKVKIGNIVNHVSLDRSVTGIGAGDRQARQASLQSDYLS